MKNLIFFLAFLCLGTTGWSRSLDRAPEQAEKPKTQTGDLCFAVVKQILGPYNLNNQLLNVDGINFQSLVMPYVKGEEEVMTPFFATIARGLAVELTLYLKTGPIGDAKHDEVTMMAFNCLSQVHGATRAFKQLIQKKP